MVRSDEFNFINPHCAFCATGQTNYSSVCEKMQIDESFDTSLDLRILFELNPDKSLTVQASCVAAEECLYFEVYDCISHRCRQLYCSDNQIPYFGKCIISNDSKESEYWYETYKPKDLNGINGSVLYIDIELETLSPLPTTENGFIIRRLFEKHGKIKNEMLRTQEESEIVVSLHDPSMEINSDDLEQKNDVTESPYTGIPKVLSGPDYIQNDEGGGDRWRYVYVKPS